MFWWSLCTLVTNQWVFHLKNQWGASQEWTSPAEAPRSYFPSLQLRVPTPCPPWMSPEVMLSRVTKPHPSLITLHHPPTLSKRAKADIMSNGLIVCVCVCVCARARWPDRGLFWGWCVCNSPSGGIRKRACVICDWQPFTEDSQSSRTCEEATVGHTHNMRHTYIMTHIHTLWDRCFSRFNLHVDQSQTPWILTIGIYRHIKYILPHKHVLVFVTFLSPSVDYCLLQQVFDTKCQSYF